MAILQVVTDVTGLIGVQPQNIYIKTTDTLAEVTAAGYLNQVKQQGYQLSNWQIAEVYGVDFNNGQPGSLLFQVQTPSNPSTGNYTLIPMSSSGVNVTLPVTVGHLASFADTSGNIQDSGVNFAGGYTFAGTLTGNTAVTFPTSGTLSTTTGTVTSVSGTANVITSTGGATPVINIANTYAGQNSINTVGTLTSGTWNASTVAVNHGGTGVTTVTTAPTATAFAGWDANKNLSANNLIEAYATTATSTTPVTLTAASAAQQYFTGTPNQTLVLPVASTLALGQSFIVVNNARGTVTVQSSGGNTVQSVATLTTATFTCILTSGTDATSWSVEYFTSSPLTLNAYSLAGNQTGSAGFPGSVTLAGNQLVFSGSTLGLDPAVPGVMQDFVFTTVAPILAMYTTPYQLLPNLAAGSMYIISEVQFIMSGTGASGTLTNGGDVYLQYGSTVQSTHSDACQRLPVATFILMSADASGRNPWYTVLGGTSRTSGNITDLNLATSGVGVYLTNSGAAFTGGSTLNLEVIITGYVWTPQI